ncbi:BnaC08g45630D [Brassica napus]|uniref:BnaC08g45630D protein n=1 Tax=Brassica napus TaxID=3708 RepID=A0A078HGF7_BRANA|nr:BnaC08g45630D [Brassica napus]
MCLFSKEIRSPCSSFTSSHLHCNLDDFVTSRSRVVCQEALKMIFISSNIELQIYCLKLVSLRTYECIGSTQSVGELTGSVRLSHVATIPRLTVATAPPLTVDVELIRSVCFLVRSVIKLHYFQSHRYGEGDSCVGFVYGLAVWLRFQ